MTGSRLQEVKLGHYKGQNATTSNWRSYWQTQGSKILQQTRFDLGIQQYINQGRRWMEGCILNQQRTIRTMSNVLQTMQLARNFSKNDEQHIPGTPSWRHTSKLHGWLRNPSKDKKRTRRTDNQIPEDCRKTLTVF